MAATISPELAIQLADLLRKVRLHYISLDLVALL